LRKYNVKRYETKTGALDFKADFPVNGGRKYTWGCQATSLNPGNPKYKTDPKSGSAETEFLVESAGSMLNIGSVITMLLIFVTIAFY